MVAMTITLTILSMVYGTYSAATESTRRCSGKIASAAEARALLEKMTRQIRSAWPAPIHPSAPSLLKHKQLDPAQTTTSHLLGEMADNNGMILRFVTTAAIITDKKFPHGPFEVAYKYDPSRKTLFYSQQKYIPQKKRARQDTTWLALAKNIESFEMSFYDGQRWHDKWTTKQPRPLPRAIKINISVAYNKTQPTDFRTIAHIQCQNTIAGQNGT